MTEYYNNRGQYGQSGLTSRPLQDGEIPLEPSGGGGMSIGESALSVGDIIVSTTSSPVSRLIRLATNSKVSHAALYVGDGMVVEAVDGVELRPLADALADDEYAVAFTDPDLTDEQRLMIRDFAGNQIGRSYDFVAIARHGLYRVSGPVCDSMSGLDRAACNLLRRRVMFADDDADRWYCSELVFAAERTPSDAPACS